MVKGIEILRDTERRNNGQSIDAKDIKKHRNDVFRIVPLLTTGHAIDVPASIRLDIEAFLENMKKETIDLKRLGLQNRSFESINTLYANLYQCTNT